MRLPRPLTGLFLLTVVLSSLRGLVACGDRTGLLVDEQPQLAPEDAAPDQFRPRDAASEDVRDAPFVEEDALPPIDVRPKPDVFLNDCPDAASTLVYVITEQNILFSFYPPTATFTQIGPLSCPTPDSTWTPFSMAVDRKGTAYVLFTPSSQQTGVGQLYRVSTATGACVATPYMGGQLGINSFGMGFVGSPDGKTDTLYVASDAPNGAMFGQLATIDLTTFLLKPIGPVLNDAELSGTGDGRLFDFYPLDPTQTQTSPTVVSQIDPLTAQVVASNNLPGVSVGTAWAFAFWGGDFYLFTGLVPSPSTVTRFRPSDGSVVPYAMAPDTITGAGVSTCAPQQ